MDEMKLEEALRAALKPCDPGEDFTQAVIARVAAAPARPRWYVPVGLAASVLIAITGFQVLQVRQERAQAARNAEQLLVALEIASEQVNKVQLRLQSLNQEENGT